MINIPEVQLIEIIRNFLRAIKVNYETKNGNSVPEESFLGKMYSGLIYEDRDIFEEAVALFVTRQSNTQSASSRQIKLSSYYNRDIIDPPGIHVLNPKNEDWMNSFSSGFGEGEVFFDDTNFLAQDSRTRRFQQVHIIMFTSDSHIEVQLLYWTIKLGLVSILDTLSLDLFQDPRFIGSELRLKEDSAPNKIYSRALTIQSFTEFEITNFLADPNFRNILFPRSNDITGGDIGDDSLTINN